MQRPILITGADGFIGSHLAEHLAKAGYPVRAMTLYNSFNSWGWLDNSAFTQDMEMISGDIRDPFFCQQAVKGCSSVFNLAALIAIPYSYQAPASYVATNIEGTVNLLQAARNENIEHFIQTSTSEVYGTARYIPIDEDHPLQPQSPYSASKISSDSMAMSYYNAFDLPVTLARPFNTYGPRQSARAVIPTIITQIAAGKTHIQLGDLSPTRDFNFVEDTCNGLISLLGKEQTLGEVINIGSNTEVSILDTVHMIRDIMNSGVDIIHDSNRIRPEKSEVHRLVCDNSKLLRLTGYKHQISLEEGLKKTIEWFCIPDNLSRYKADQYNV
ncbi:MAG: NAD-dependent dehydratase [Thalassobium sp.]|uniref:NAD-dependent 4,6-dehydratase LegB n=1 Tax=Thalassolituus pacificus TaxID=2975440 RepID=A0A9X2WBL2_9GAMM|nr:NAD-dependent 4,6-dehydratase LegB [Thalassolituus pacificus]MCT7357488.1 NAD-dependent 4,6-dehydratase LegB [Thalassolituus pacificus]PHS63187.1 MAG: NAD-dependent dehydratase [Thalassobium sp.]